MPMSRLNDMVHRILRTEFACGIIDDPPEPRVVDVFGGLEIAQKTAELGMVLLRNRNQLLPLNGSKLKSIAVIGSHADIAVLSGGGSAQVDPPGGNAVPPPPRPHKPGEDPMAAVIDALLNTVVWHPSSPLKAIRGKAPSAKVAFDSGADIHKAAALAAASEVAIVFVNQPTAESRDSSLTLPGNQNELVSAVAAANPRTVVVLENGGPVTMPWIEKIDAALEAWYPGIRGGEAIANVLFGDVNPSGRLPVTFPVSANDLPHPVMAAPPVKRGPLDGVFETLPPFDIPYPEGLEVGYKWFAAAHKNPLFAFGHGLSYTDFTYSDLNAQPKRVTVVVKNTGHRDGVEIVQLYASLPQAAGEPPRRLVAWQRVQLAPGESKPISLEIDPWFLSIYDTVKEAWKQPDGEYRLFVGGSSDKSRLTGQITTRVRR